MASQDQKQACSLAAQGQVCRFSEIDAKNSYPPRFARCEGSLASLG